MKRRSDVALSLEGVGCSHVSDVEFNMNFFTNVRIANFVTFMKEPTHHGSILREFLHVTCHVCCVVYRVCAVRICDIYICPCLSEQHYAASVTRN